MTVADNFLKQSRRFGLGDISKKQMAMNLVSDTEVSNPNIPNVNVRGGPNIPTTPTSTQIGARREARASVTQRFRPAGVPQGVSFSTKAWENVGSNINRAKNALIQNRTNPFGIDPADTTASLFAFKEGGFVNKK